MCRSRDGLAAALGSEFELVSEAELPCATRSCERMYSVSGLPWSRLHSACLWLRLQSLLLPCAAHICKPVNCLGWTATASHVHGRRPGCAAPALPPLCDLRVVQAPCFSSAHHKEAPIPELH